MAGRLEGRSAVVTGAARGIGRATAEVYAREGARVLVVDRDAEAAATAAGEIGKGSVACTADVTKREDVQAMAAAAAEQFGGIDILTQNAGIYPNHLVEEITDDEWALVMNVNVRSALYTVQACLPHLKKSDNGRITITSSITGPKVGYPGLHALRRVEGGPERLHPVARARAGVVPDHRQRRRAGHGADARA